MIADGIDGALRRRRSSGRDPLIVIGAGLGGLTAALALLKRGIDVEVYEQASVLREVGAGVQISPNGSRVLDSLGILDAVRRVACQTEGKEVRLWSTGQTWKLFDLGAEAVRRYGFPYFTVYRVDLHHALIEAVRNIKDLAIHLDRRCTSVENVECGVTVRFADGSEVRGRAVVGADGIHSAVRNSLFGTVESTYAGLMAWRCVIPMERVPAHLRRPIATNWVGPGGHVIHYPLRGGELMNFVGFVEREEWVAESWNVQGSIDECLHDFAGWNDDVQSLIRSAEALFKWGMLQRSSLQNWTVGNATLLGDACHAMFPFLAQGAVMALEDGLILGRAFQHCAGDEQSALMAYEQARMERTYRVVEGSASNVDRFHNRQLADPVEGPRYIEREWASRRVQERYDWIFDYDATSMRFSATTGFSSTT
jgi:salicylate hydroxylase